MKTYVGCTYSAFFLHMNKLSSELYILTIVAVGLLLLSVDVSYCGEQRAAHEAEATAEFPLRLILKYDRKTQELVVNISNISTKTVMMLSENLRQLQFRYVYSVSNKDIDSGFSFSVNSEESNKYLQGIPKEDLTNILASKSMNVNIPIKTAIPEIDKIKALLPRDASIEIQAYLDCSIVVSGKHKKSALEDIMLLSNSIEVSEFR